jgi:hypothetical protein
MVESSIIYTLLGVYNLSEFELVMNGNNYCKFHGKVGHYIDDCEEFHQ